MQTNNKVSYLVFRVRTRIGKLSYLGFRVRTRTTRFFYLNFRVRTRIRVGDSVDKCFAFNLIKQRGEGNEKKQLVRHAF